MDDDIDGLSGGQRYGLERFRGGRDIIVPVRLPEREILAEIADGR